MERGSLESLHPAGATEGKKPWDISTQELGSRNLGVCLLSRSDRQDPWCPDTLGSSLQAPVPVPPPPPRPGSSLTPQWLGQHLSTQHQESARYLHLFSAPLLSQVGSNRIWIPGCPLWCFSHSLPLQALLEMSQCSRSLPSPSGRRFFE